MHPEWKRRVWLPASLIALGVTWAILLWLAARCPTDIAVAPHGCVDFWLNRYQTLIGIGGALLAACIAARPVWAQLKEMQAVSAVQAYESLRGLQQRVEEDWRLMWRLKSLISLSPIIEGRVRAAQLSEFDMLRGQLEDEAKKIEVLMLEVEKAGTSPWGDGDARVARSQIGVDVAGLAAANINTRQILHTIRSHHIGVVNDKQWLADRQCLSEISGLSSAANKAEAACDNYINLVKVERARLHPLVNRVRKRADEAV